MRNLDLGSHPSLYVVDEINTTIWLITRVQYYADNLCVVCRPIL